MFLPSQRRSINNAINEQAFHAHSFELEEPSKSALKLVHQASGFYFLIQAAEVVLSGARSGKEMRLYTYSTPKRGKLMLATDEKTVHGPIDDWETVVYLLNQWLELVKSELPPEQENYEEEELDLQLLSDAPNAFGPTGLHPLGLMHPLVHYTAGPLFLSGHYPQALLSACTALDKLLQQHTGQPAELTGTALMNKVFSPDNPLIRLSPVRGEQQGYLFLFNGLTQAIRNHYAHNLTELSNVNRALEWLGFISVLCYQIQGSLEAMSHTATES